MSAHHASAREHSMLRTLPAQVLHVRRRRLHRDDLLGNPNPDPNPNPNPNPNPSHDQVKGGKITIDAGSLSDQFKTENDKRFESSGDVAKLESSPAMATIKADSQS